jgi:small subunit ribosomal protein S6
MTILDPDLEDDAIQATVARISDAVSSRGGRVHGVDRWGKRRLAYELDHRWEGYYVLFQVTVEPAVVADLDRILTLTDEVIRYKIIRVPDAVASWAPEAPTGSAAS